MTVNTTRFPLRGMQPRSTTTQRARVPHPQRPSDDEILGLVTAVARPAIAAASGASASADAPAMMHAPSPTIAQSSANDASADDASAASADPAAQATA